MAPAASAALIAYESFESYTTGSNLGGASGGTGWSTNWTSTDPHVTTQGFTLTDPTGNLSSGSNSARMLQTTTTTADYGSFMSRTFAAQTGTVYMSFLIRPSTGVDSADFYNFMLSNGGTGNSVNALGVGIRNAASNPFFARAGSSSAGQTTNASTNAVLDTTYLLVAKFWKDGSTDYNRVDLFINPTGPDEPGTASATAIYASTAINTISMFNIRNFNPEQNDTLYFDELRIGTTWADVLPVPEPSGLLLGGLSALLLLRRRRHG